MQKINTKTNLTRNALQKNLHDIVALLNHAIQGDSAFRFRTPEQRVKVVDFDDCQNAQKLIGYHSNIHGLPQNLCLFCNRHTCDYLR